MQKRVGLARAIAAEPEIIFFDEPTTGLDPIMAGVINDLIREIVTEMGATAMTITHDMSSVRAIADRVAMLHDGVIRWRRRPAPPRAWTSFDRVLGGGLVPASAILVGGDPGIGKSTLLLQAAASFARKGLKCLYISGEEASGAGADARAAAGPDRCAGQLGAETNLRDILTTLDAERPGAGGHRLDPDHVAGQVEARPGSVSQVRASAHELVTFAKRRGVSVILVGHVTKDGQIAGPRVVEHMVDTVLYFEGERGHQFRILRAVKNRFGPADEIGVFEMTGGGLAEVPTPRRCSCPTATSPPRDRPSLPGSRARARADRDSGAGRALAPSAARAARWWGWIRAASPPSSPCWRRAAASPSPGLTCS
jgi:predicted ATP-dependent serine protease